MTTMTAINGTQDNGNVHRRREFASNEPPWYFDIPIQMMDRCKLAKKETRVKR